MTRQDARRNIDQDPRRSVHTHPCCRQLWAVMSLPLALALLAHPTRALADGPAPSQQVEVEVAADAGEAAPEIESGETLDLGETSKSGDAPVEDQQSPSQGRDSGQEDQPASEKVTEEASAESDLAQTPTPQDGEASPATGSTSSSSATGQVDTTPIEANRMPDATSTVATGPAATLIVWATRYPVGTCLAAGVLVTLALTVLRTRGDQDVRQDVGIPSYHRRYHYLL